jgi:hypothetical protein
VGRNGEPVQIFARDAGVLCPRKRSRAIKREWCDDGLHDKIRFAVIPVPQETMGTKSFGIVIGIRPSALIAAKRGTVTSKCERLELNID